MSSYHTTPTASKCDTTDDMMMHQAIVVAQQGTPKALAVYVFLFFLTSPF